MARYACGADYAEVVMAGELARYARSVGLDLEPSGQLLQSDSPLIHSTLPPTPNVGQRGVAPWATSVAVVPLTGPSGEVGWIAVANQSNEPLHHESIERLESAVVMVQDHLDRNVERIRMSWLSASLRENQIRLQDSTERLNASNRQLEQFAYIASHELVAPLRVVSVYAQLLQQLIDDPDPNPQQLSSCMAEIRDGVAKMSQQVKSLLDLSSVDANTASLELTDLDDVVRAALDTLADLIADADPIDISIGELPVVAAQSVPFQSVFANLFTNAVRYRHPDRPLEISVTARTEKSNDGGTEVIEVRDNGRGIDPEHQSRVFELFDRGESTDSAGSGIGLALSRRIVEAFGGTIGVDPATRHGTAFVITLPAAS